MGLLAFVERWKELWTIFWKDRPMEKGSMIGEYEVLDLLGAGSYGIAYLVRHRRSGVKQVLKQSRPSSASKPLADTAFEREIEILSRLNHPSIPKLRGHFHEAGRDCFVMDYIDGATFEELIFTEGQLYSEQESFSVLRKILDVVSYLHSLRIIHRDLRIPNILCRDDHIYMIDFGLACYWDASAHATNEPNSTEQDPRREPHVRSDFYALGHFVLFLLYSSYEASPHQEERSWQEELLMHPKSKQTIERMLQIQRPYSCVEELIEDVELVQSLLA